MRDKFEATAFIGGLFIGIVMGCAVLAVILLQVAPALKDITRYSYTPSKHAHRLTSNVGADAALFNSRDDVFSQANSFSGAHTAGVDRPFLGVSSQTKPRR